jgi:single-strand DNA-binding protein
MLKIILNGTVGNDAEVKNVGEREAINFRIAVPMDYKNKKGEKVDKTEWVQAVIWKSKGKNSKIADYLKKGKKVLIEGVPEAEGYKANDGTIKSYLHVNVKDIEFMN